MSINSNSGMSAGHGGRRSTARRSFPLRLALAAILASAAAPSPAVETGSVAAPFDVPGAGGPVRLSDYRGKLVYLDFWASWCAPCKHSFPWMNAMQARYGSQGLQVLAVNVDARQADAAEFLSVVPAAFTVGFDPAGKVAASYGIKGMPSSVLIGPDGKVVATHVGFNDADREELENLVRRNLPAAADKRGG